MNRPRPRIFSPSLYREVSFDVFVGWRVLICQDLTHLHVDEAEKTDHLVGVAGQNVTLEGQRVKGSKAMGSGVKDRRDKQGEEIEGRGKR